MNKSVKKVLVTGASLLMLASAGAGASQVVNPVHASRSFVNVANGTGFGKYVPWHHRHYIGHGVGARQTNDKPSWFRKNGHIFHMDTMADITSIDGVYKPTKYQVHRALIGYHPKRTHYYSKQYIKNYMYNFDRQVNIPNKLKGSWVHYLGSQNASRNYMMITLSHLNNANVKNFLMNEAGVKGATNAIHHVKKPIVKHTGTNRYTIQFKYYPFIHGSNNLVLHIHLLGHNKMSVRSNYSESNGVYRKANMKSAVKEHGVGLYGIAELNKEHKSSRKNNSVAPMRPVNVPSWLNGYWIRDGSTSMHVTGFHVKNYRASQQRYWQINKNGRDVPYITSFNFGKGGSHFTYRDGKYSINNAQHPYAIIYYQPTGHNRMKIIIVMKSRGHNSIKKFRGSYYKVSHHHFQDINNSLDSVNHYNFDK